MSNGEEDIAYELSNTDVFKMGEVFERIFGEFRHEVQKTILEISLVEDFHAVHSSIGEAVRHHNNRTGNKLEKGHVSRCIAFSSKSAGNSAFIEIDFDDKEDIEYITRVCNFVRFQIKPNYTKAKKLKWNWIISRDLICAKCGDEIILREGELCRRGRKMCLDVA